MEQSTPDRVTAPDGPAGPPAGAPAGAAAGAPADAPADAPAGSSADPAPAGTGTSVVAPGGSSTGGSTDGAGPLDRRAAALSALGDVVAVLVFVTIGRRSHAEGLDLAGVLATAVPFLGALAVGWVATLAWRSPTALRTGVLVWLSTVVLGVALRGLGGEGVPVSFVIVTAVVLALLLVGWRAVVLLVRRRRARS